jgi:Flp pilus assembly protein TadD
VLAVEALNLGAKLVLGRSLLRQGWAALAAVELREVAARHAADGAVQFALADALNAAGEPAPAVSHYRRAVALGVQSPDLHNNCGAALARLGDTVGAIAAWRAALALDEANAFAQERLHEAGASREP